MTYEKPIVVDYGRLQDVTAAITIVGTEDGASKLDTPNHHSVP
ncbi:MAG: lasso RiPP family leader peptide-containing protein [Thermoleophilaceae bacterium]